MTINMKKKIVFLTGSGISVESGLSTFRDADGLWESVDVKTVATHAAWQNNPEYVNNFYNMLRIKYKDAKPNDAHKIIADLENDYDVTVITQNVDNLHEQAGSTNVIHLHGEIMKMCSEFDVENVKCHIQLPHEGFGETGLEVPAGTKALDGYLLRPYIVFFDEPVPNMLIASDEVQSADILVVIGTSLQVYPAAGLIYDANPNCKRYVIDPNPIDTPVDVQHIMKTASQGMKELKFMISQIS